MFWSREVEAQEDVQHSNFEQFGSSLDLIHMSPSPYRLIQWIPDVPRDLSWLSSLAGDLYKQTMTDEDQDQDLER